jgi:outer membrane receptor protein involved in Fe transport
MTQRSVLLSGTVACLAASVHLCAATAAADTAGLQEHDLHIDRQPLARALQEFARQAGTQVIFFSAVTRGSEAPALNGRFTTEAALRQLLSDTTLTFREIHPNTIQICLRIAAPCMAGTGPRPTQVSSDAQPTAIQSPTSTTSNSEASTIGSTKGVNMKSEIIAAALLAGSSAFVLSSAALAQATARAAGSAPESELTEVVVTGSRVIANGNDSPTPVTVVTTEELAAVHPGNLAETLNDMPVFAASRSQYSNTGTSGAAGSPASSNNATNVINLRGFGLTRTLILYDGHRVPQNTPDGTVDINSIPQMLLKRVDVVTGGVSAVYGSDGITGVVNFITDTGFQGLKVEMQAGRSGYNDGDTAEGGIAFGTNLFGGRGHFMGSYSNRSTKGMTSKLVRQWGKDMRSIQGDGTAAVPYFQTINTRSGNNTFGGRINGANNLATNPLYDQQFTSGGILVPFIHGSKVGISAGSSNEIGGDGSYGVSQLRSPLDMNQFYGRFDFDFSDNVHGSLSAADTLNHSFGNGGYYNNNNLTLSRDNAYLLPQYRTAMVNANQTTFALGKSFSSFPRSQLESFSRQLLVNAGLQGSLGNGYKWDVGYAKGNSSFDVRQNGALNNGRLFAAFDSVPSGGWVNGLPVGSPICRAALLNPAYAGCVPISPFGVNSESQASIDYVAARGNWQTKLGMDDLAASITGAPFNSWAGPINTALSAEWRKLTYQIDSNFPPSAHPDCRLNASLAAGAANRIANCNETNQPFYNGAAVQPLSQVSTKVSEAAVEFNVPLLKDARFAKTLDFNAAYRFAHYDYSGNARTWKIGATYTPIDKLTFRATRSRDFRAPNLDELFRPLAVTLSGFTDTITGTQVAQNNIVTENSGSPNLKPEIGDTLTAGVVFRPTANFDIAIDGFDVKVKDSIILVQGNNPDWQNACYSTRGASIYCQFIGRGLGIYDPTNPLAFSAANAVNKWVQKFINVAENDTWGADIEMGYRARIFNRALSLRLLSTYQPHVIEKDTQGLPTFDYGGVSFGTNGRQATPVWRLTGFVNFKPTDELTVAVQTRWRSSLKHHASPLVVFSGAPVKAVSFTNVNVAYAPKVGAAKLEVFLNVQNVFNTDPPQAGFWGNQGPGGFGEFVQGDDVIGRYYTAGLRLRL